MAFQNIFTMQWISCQILWNFYNVLWHMYRVCMESSFGWSLQHGIPKTAGNHWYPHCNWHLLDAGAMFLQIYWNYVFRLIVGTLAHCSVLHCVVVLKAWMTHKLTGKALWAADGANEYWRTGAHRLQWCLRRYTLHRYLRYLRYTGTHYTGTSKETCFHNYL